MAGGGPDTDWEGEAAWKRGGERGEEGVLRSGDDSSLSELNSKRPGRGDDGDDVFDSEFCAGGGGDGVTREMKAGERRR